MSWVGPKSFEKQLKGTGTKTLQIMTNSTWLISWRRPCKRHTPDPRSSCVSRQGRHKRDRAAVSETRNSRGDWPPLRKWGRNTPSDGFRMKEHLYHWKMQVSGNHSSAVSHSGFPWRDEVWRVRHWSLSCRWLRGPGTLSCYPSRWEELPRGHRTGYRKAGLKYRKKKTKLISDFSLKLFCALVEQRSFRHVPDRSAYFSPIWTKNEGW